MLQVSSTSKMRDYCRDSKHPLAVHLLDHKVVIKQQNSIIINASES